MIAMAEEIPEIIATVEGVEIDTVRLETAEEALARITSSLAAPKATLEAEPEWEVNFPEAHLWNLRSTKYLGMMMQDIIECEVREAGLKGAYVIDEDHSSRRMRVRAVATVRKQAGVFLMNLQNLRKVSRPLIDIEALVGEKIRLSPQEFKEGILSIGDIDT